MRRELELGTAPGAAVRPALRGGFTLVEALLVVLIVGVVVGIAVPSYRGLANELENAGAETAAYFRQVRTQAMTTTSAYRVVVASDTELRSEHATVCDDDEWTPDTRLILNLRDRASIDLDGMEPGVVITCFNSRGIGNASPILTVRQAGGRTLDVEVFLGGGVRVVRPDQGGQP